VGVTLGVVLFGTGIVLVLLGIPRRGEDVRPFLRHPVMPILYPSICLVLIAMGLATLASSVF
jgi:hypothetical protein